MTEKKKKYWEEPGWDPLSPKRKYPWKLSDVSDYLDILSTYDCMIPDETQDEPASADQTNTDHQK